MQNNKADSEKNKNNAFIEPEHHDSDCEEYDSKIMDCDSEVNNKLEQATTNVNSTMPDQNSAEKLYNDKGVQVTSGDLNVSFCAFIRSEKDLITMCNIKSFQILNELTNLMDEIYPQKKTFIKYS